MMLRQMLELPNYGWRSAFNDLENMRQEMNRLFGQVSGRPYWQTHAGVFPLVNIVEDTTHYFIFCEIPGMVSEEIDISATGRSLTISGERKIITEGENVKYHRREREGGTFNRVIALPNDIQVNEIVAEYIEGILTLTLPKTKTKNPKQIFVK